MIVRHPGRVLAASFRGGCHKQFGDPVFRSRFTPVALNVPLLFVWGKRESVPTSSHYVSWEPMNTMFCELRTQGGKVCRVIDPRSEHGCDDSRLMSLSFFDAVLSGDARGMDSNDASMPWMPNPTFAKRWQEFLETGTLRPIEPKLSAPELSTTRDATGKTQLTWRIIPEISGGLRALRIYRDGKIWKELGLKPGDFLATSADSAPEILRGEGTSDHSLGPHTYSITFLDAAGNESPHSQ